MVVKSFYYVQVIDHSENIEGDVFSFDDDLVKIIQISIIVKVQDIYCFKLNLHPAWPHLQGGSGTQQGC